MSHTITAAARLLNTSRRTIQRYIKRGYIQKTAEGGVRLTHVANASKWAKVVSKGRGRPLGAQASEKTRRLPLASAGFHRGRTQIQRVEIICRELEAIRDPLCHLWLLKHLEKAALRQVSSDPEQLAAMQTFLSSAKPPR